MQIEAEYEAVALLGCRFDENGGLPEDVIIRLDIARTLLEEGVIGRIIPCGKYSIHWGWEGLHIEALEYEEMTKYLLSRGVDEERILHEPWSQDTPGNIYFLKTGVLIPERITSVLILCSKPNLRRVKFLCRKILGSDVRYEIRTTPTSDENDAALLEHEAVVLAEQQAWLADMPDGDHHWLDGQFYSAPYYTDQLTSRRRVADMKRTIR